MPASFVRAFYFALQLDCLAADWIALPPMPSPRCLFAMGEFDNLLFAVAGKDLQTNESHDTVMCYDTEWVQQVPVHVCD